MKDRANKSTHSIWQFLFFGMSMCIIIFLLWVVAGNKNLDVRTRAHTNGSICTQLCQRVCSPQNNPDHISSNDRCVSKCTSVCNRVVSRQRRTTPRPTSHPTHSNTTSNPYPTAIPTTPPQTNQGHDPQTPQTYASTHWHMPGAHDGLNTHEHGDKPPAWADEFSQKHFHHPVIYGGDEATPNENALKHQAYKGFLMRANNVDIFIRYHSMSMPTDRSGPLHSYEVYAKDTSGNVSFWQGWIFHGYPERRDQRMARHNEQPGHDSTNGITWPGRNQFIISGADLVDWERYLRCEQWYGHAGTWSWDLSITICGAATHYHVDEHLEDVYNRATWNPTGSVGGSRRLEVSHYGPQNPNVTGVNLPFDKWFCVQKLPNENRASGMTPTWNISGAVSGPNACQNGWLPQYVANTFPKEGVYFKVGNTAEKDFPTTGVTIPN